MAKSTKNLKNLIIWLCVTVAFVVAFSAIYISGINGGHVSEKISAEKAQSIIDTTVKELPASLAAGSKTVLEKAEITVKSVNYGNSKDVILTCDYSVTDVSTVFNTYKQELIDSAYKYAQQLKADGKSTSATKIRQKLQPRITEILDGAKVVTGSVDITLYEITKGNFEMYLDDATVNVLTGGILDVIKEIEALDTACYNGKEVNISNEATLRTGIKQFFALDNYTSTKPATGNWLTKLVDDFAYEFNRNFIEGNKWVYLVSGLGMTLAITLCAGVMGIVLGFIVAIIRCTNEITGKLRFVDRICRIYLTVIRGTPVMVQLLIIYFVIFLPIGVPKFISAVLCFGLNSGAYVAEIVRGGIMSIDKGQTEAGRSLGFGYAPTMINFIIPQAFKAVLPALANEFITLLKESSVAFYIGVSDLTQGGLRIRSITFSSFMPLIAVALIYLAIVMILTKLVGILERRLRRSEH